MNTKCEWCVNPNTDEAKNPELLCRTHEAEYEGLSVEGLDWRDAEQHAEYIDSVR